MCLAQGQNAVRVRLEPAALPSLVKHSTTEPLRSPQKRKKFVISSMTYGKMRLQISCELTVGRQLTSNVKPYNVTKISTRKIENVV